MGRARWQTVALTVWLLLDLVAAAALGPRTASSASAGPVDLRLELLADALDEPLFVTHAGDGSGRLFVVERGGLIRVLEEDQLQREPFLDLSSVVGTQDLKQGLLGLAFDPDYPTTGELYVSYTARDGANRVARYRVSDDPNVVDPDNAELVLELPDRLSDHNVGMLAFGPDGHLYVATGDEGGAGDPFGNAQDLTSLYGKLLRIDVRGQTTYAIPADNPFASGDDARGEIWALGLRSPWRFAFDRATGDLWLGDVGETHYEEINRQPADSPGGENYGWNVLEGSHCYPPGRICDSTPYVAPVDEYDHSLGCSVTGGYVYRGHASPALSGMYLYGDFCSGRIWALQPAAGAAEGWTRTEVWHDRLYVSSFGEDEDGELYVTDLVGGKLYRLWATAEYPEPVVDGIDPSFVAPGSPGFTLHVYGSGFRRESSISWGDQARHTAYVDSTQLTAFIPATLVTQAHDRPIYVVNPPPGGGASNQHIFRITPSDMHADAFLRTWAHTDQPVASGLAHRTWMWGPAPFSGVLREEYAEAPGGARAVQYFDKARMEVTGTGGDTDALWFVTNGLLAKELMTGVMQLGDDTFAEGTPAAINVAGDPDDPAGPTYATLGALLEEPALVEGASIVGRIDRDGITSGDTPLGEAVTAAAHVPETDHTVASVFWEFMNSDGPVLQADQIVVDPLFESPFYATGYPLTEAYWTTVRVNGTQHEVLVQCFQRRCLTYTPGNPPGWQVETGNVGRHYYRWRYEAQPDISDQLEHETVVRGLSDPTAMAFAPDGRTFIAEQAGAVRVVRDGELLDEPFVTVETIQFSERGLLGLALDPAFADNGYVYVYYTVSSPVAHNRVSRFRAQGDTAEPGSEDVLLELSDLNNIVVHNGGGMRFGPDGRLYIGTGDNGYGPNSASLETMLGKVLRINPDGTIPTDNPFYGQATGDNRAIWAYGLRNAYSFAFQPGTGRMFIDDVGSDLWEEINEGLAGGNYGWPYVEGVAGDSRFIDPLFVYANGDVPPQGCALSGGTFYNPPRQLYPSGLSGDYFFVDFCRGFIRVFDPLTGRDYDFTDDLVFPVGITTGSDGALYVLQRGRARGDGAIVRVGLSTP